MNWLQEVLDQFGQQLGLPGWQLGDSGVARMDLQAGGLLAVEPALGASEVLVYLGRPLGFDGDTVLRSALERAHHDSAYPVHVQVAVRGRGPDALLIVLARVAAAEFTAATLNHLVEFLNRWADGVRNA